MKQYYYAEGDQQKGPFSFEELRTKKISRGTYVWYEGLSDWTPAGDLAELGSLFQEAPRYAEPPEPDLELNTPPPVSKRQPVYNQGRSQGGYQYPNTPSGQKPKTWLVEAILVTVLCCLPTGIAAIVFASRVDSKWAQGDIAGAQKASENAKLWTMISLGVGLVVTVIYVLIGLAGGF